MEKFLFNPCANECTTFENVRVLHFLEKSINININVEFGGEKFTNMKPFVLYYDTKRLKIMNTLQKVKLESKNMKVTYKLDELIELSNIEQLLIKWIEHLLDVRVLKN